MKRILLLMIPCIILCIACETKPKQKEMKVATVGSDSDAHGCKGSAGYQWSELLQDCVRLWEVGVAVLPVGDTTQAGYIVFAKDSLRAELFLPNIENSPVVLDRDKLSDGTFLWNDDTFKMKQSSGLWEITQQDRVLFKER